MKLVLATRICMSAAERHIGVDDYCTDVVRVAQLAGDAVPMKENAWLPPTSELASIVERSIRSKLWLKPRPCARSADGPDRRGV